uniref:Dynactin subunit 6 n=1 Tax=Heterorhabditis bacteriophora TaxID=37862 RepID=A0A1I7WF10_HETBA
MKDSSIIRIASASNRREFEGVTIGNITVIANTVEKAGSSITIKEIKYQKHLLSAAWATLKHDMITSN